MNHDDDDETQGISNTDFASVAVQAMTAQHLVIALIKTLDLSGKLGLGDKATILMLFKEMQNIPYVMALNGELPDEFLELLHDYDRQVTSLLS